MARIGIVHPGEMGAWVAASLRETGHEVWWASDGRSTATRQRAYTAGLADAGGLGRLVASVDAVVSVCPPAAALDTAGAVVEAGFRGRYVDANAIAPETARRIGALVESAGGTMVDGGILGGAGDAPGSTRLYLSGDGAHEVAAWFTTGRPEPVVVDGGGVGAASAVKVGFAGWTKGSAALLLAMRAYARAEGVEDVVLDAWDHGLDGVRERSDRVAATVHRKAWRFVGEMEQLAGALAEAGLPSGFHGGAAAVYASLADIRHRPVPQEVDDVLDHVLGREVDPD
jgi:3-hydroxyisobutyrate dehydrogenase-like beta-hydroxyacid dehydrogenase